MTLFACDRCGLVYANIYQLRAVSDGHDIAGEWYLCVATNREDPLCCAGKIRKLREFL